MCNIAYELVGADWRKHVTSDPRFLRPLETGTTIADASKARTRLGWIPTTRFEDMLTDMIAAHVDRLKATLANTSVN